MIAAALCLALVGHVVDAHDSHGLPGVEVSNGSDVAVTNEEGAYELPDRGRFVFVIKPSGWIAAGQTPDWYGPRNEDAPGGATDFILTPHRESAAFRALVLTDAQPANEREVAFLRRSLAEPLARVGADERADFALMLGDITYDRPALYPAINAALHHLGIPWFPVNGNHDLNLGIAGDGAVGPYEALYGPSTYAFHWGPALFIALNDVRHEGGLRYHGGLLPEQWAFLQGVLAREPPSAPVILFFHIPLFATDPFGNQPFPVPERERLLGLLHRFAHAVLLSGHTHVLRHVTYPGGLREFNVAAACGGFWTGPNDAAGIPVSTMADGTPPGYGLLSVSASAIGVQYRRRPDLGPSDTPDAQMDAHVPAVVPTHQGYVPLFANVYDGGDDWQVTAQVDDRAPVPMQMTISWDPNYAAAYLAQDTAGARLTPNPRRPEPAFCYHLWKSILPGDLAPGEHHVRFAAHAPDGRAPAITRTFRVADPP